VQPLSIRLRTDWIVAAMGGAIETETCLPSTYDYEDRHQVFIYLFIMCIKQARP